MKDKLKKEILKAFKNLIEDDGELFGCHIEEGFEYDARKLYEVCINHKLATHLENTVLPLFSETKEEKIFVDIEFNKEGKNSKVLHIEGEDKVVRPDIIIHNRKSGEMKKNFLVVECKKIDSNNSDIEYDKKKIHAFLTNSKYEYQYGLQAIYDKKVVQGTLFYKNDKEEIEDEPITYISES